MVDFRWRPLPANVKPCQPMRIVASPLYSNPHIAVGARATSLFASLVTAVVFSPKEQAASAPVN